MLTSYLIQLACANAYYNNACHKASEAFTKQAGIESTLSSVEGYSKTQAKHIAVTYLGEAPLRYAAVAYGAYHTVSTKTLVVHCPTLGLADSVTSEVNPSSSKLTLQWKF